MQKKKNTINLQIQMKHHMSHNLEQGPNPQECVCIYILIHINKYIHILYVLINICIFKDPRSKFVNNLQGGWFDMGGCFEIILYPFSVSLNHIVWELIHFDILSNQLYVYHICHFQLSPTRSDQFGRKCWTRWVTF